MSVRCWHVVLEWTKIMISEYWMWATWLTKVILYLSVAFVVGGAFCYFLLRQYLELKESILKYITIGAGLGLISSTLGFFILIGSFANTGITGMVDPTYINILVNTPTGYIYVLCSKAINFVFPFSIIESSIFCILLIPIIFSFSQLGHVANLTLLAQILLSIHILVMSLWMGSLYPLWKTSREISGLPLKDRMHVFGRIAAFIVGILIACGASVALLLIKDFNTLINTAYGYGFMVKMFFVIGILLLAAFNKWYFTPRLQHPKFAKHLSHAILFEMLLGLSILLTTGYITTVVGIE